MKRVKRVKNPKTKMRMSLQLVDPAHPADVSPEDYRRAQQVTQELVNHPENFPGIEQVYPKEFKDKENGDKK